MPLLSSIPKLTSTSNLDITMIPTRTSIHSSFEGVSPVYSWLNQLDEVSDVQDRKEIDLLTFGLFGTFFVIG